MAPEIDKMSDVEIHAELKDSGVEVHHKTGIAKLIATLTEVRAGTYTVPEPKVETKPLKIGPTDAANKAVADSKVLTKEQRALRMQRIVVTPNDPNMNTYPGLIFTVGSSSVNNGRMIKKFVPFNNDEGWHVPQIIIDTIKNAEMQKFKMVKVGDGKKELQAYITKKFNVEILPPLTQEEMKSLAASQQASGAFN